MKNIAPSSILAVVLGASVSAQTPGWQQATTATRPSAREAHTMTYDVLRQMVVVFGGNDAAPGSLNDTWEYDGVDWSQVATASSPSARMLHALAYDLARGKVVLFGGIGGGYLNDTWEYDGTDWTQLTTSSSPSARDRHTMTYDIARGKIVLFGGLDSAGASSETWEFDGSDWTQVATANSPSARYCHAMTYDLGSGKVVLFGGYNSAAGFLGDTWEYDGTDWTQVATASGPSARDRHAMTYDLMRDKVVLFGGYNSSQFYLGDTWEYDGGNWTQATINNSPGARDRHKMTYDLARCTVVIFGGYDAGAASMADETWRYDCTNVIAQFDTFGAGCPGSPSSVSCPTPSSTPSMSASGLPRLGSVYAPSVCGAPANSLAVLVSGVSDSVSSGLALPFALPGAPGCELLVSTEVLSLALTDSLGVTQYSVAIPNNGAFAGYAIYHQWAVWDPAANSASIVMSDGGVATVGY